MSFKDIANALAADKTLCVGITTGCDKPADPSNGKGLCQSCNLLDCSEGERQAMAMNENMRKFGSVDGPADQVNPAHCFLLSYETIDGSGEVEEEFTNYEEAVTRRDSMDDLLLWSDITGPDNFCLTHKMWEAEGGPCAECERLAQLEIDKMDQAMQEQQYSLWLLCQGTHLFKVPVYNFNDAKTLYHSLNWDVVSGVRIARHCEVEGCEVVLHKFK